MTQQELFTHAAPPPFTLRDYQVAAADAVMEQFKEVSSTLVVMPTGCHARGQGIMLWTGDIVPVEEIEVGDVLMGPDSLPRIVHQLARGQGEMVRITPTKGTPFVVNMDHILTLVRTNDRSPSSPRYKYACYRRGGEIVDVSVRDWMTWSKQQKHIYKLFRVPVEFPQRLRYHFDPYWMGIFLGDGSLARGTPAITTADPEIVSEVYAIAASCGGRVRHEKKPDNDCETLHISCNYSRMLHFSLSGCGILGMTCENKHVPIEYKTSDRTTRLAVLAGLIDTDGSKAHKSGGYDFISKSKRLSEDVAFLARSVGLAAYVSLSRKQAQTGPIGDYYRVSISGDCGMIPCRIPRKRIGKRLQIKNVLRTGFRVEHLGRGEYFGFSLNGDGRYLMDDFTVTHNTGKSATAGEIARRFLPKRVIMLGHREELIFQNRRTLERMTGERVEIEMADFKAHPDSHIIVSTVQTQVAGKNGGRMTNFDPRDFGLLILDESHHAVSDSWVKVANYYRINPDLKVLGLTATPDRADEEALGQVFETVALDFEILDAIRAGWLVGVEQQMVNVHGLDFSDVRTTAGDLNGGDLAAVMEFEETLHGVADPTIKIVGDRRCLVFATSVAHAERLCEIFNRHKPNCAAWVCGKTDKDARRGINADFADGKIQFLCNVGTHTEGFDDPGVGAVVVARPTKSRALYAQMVGRGLRPLPGVVDGHELDTPEHRRAAIEASRKSNCLVLDFVGNSGRHKLMTTADILGGKYSDETVERAAKIAKDAGTAVNMEKAIELAEDQLAKEREEAERRRLAEEARRQRIRGRAQYSTSSVDPFSIYDITPRRERGWDTGKQLSEKQRALIEKHMPGVDVDSLPYGQAKQLLDAQFKRWSEGLCSFKQARLLKRAGYDPSNMKREEASALIDALAKNNWRRPA